jgi:polyhydroxyalkanoate synthesis regulator phasin
MKRGLFALLVLLIAASNSFGFGLPGLPGAKSEAQGGGAATMDDAVAAQNDLIKAYSSGVKFNLITQGLMAEALGMKDKAAKCKTTADAINEGNAEGLQASKAITDEATAEIEKKMAEAGELSAESKKKVGESLVTMAQCLIAYKTAADKSQNSLKLAQSVIESAPVTQKLSAKKQLDPVLSIAPSVPSELANVSTTATKYVQFAKSAGIQAPSDLNKALGEL